MAQAKILRMGVDSPSPSPEERKKRIAVLRATVEKYIPDFARAIAEAAKSAGHGGHPLMLHQDAFAGGYDDDEYTLLGMAVKYAGLHGVEVTVIGKNRETL
jgi:hypothetical protein